MDELDLQYIKMRDYPSIDTGSTWQRRVTRCEPSWQAVKATGKTGLQQICEAVKPKSCINSGTYDLVLLLQFIFHLHRDNWKLIGTQVCLGCGLRDPSHLRWAEEAGRWLPSNAEREPSLR